MWAKQAIVQRHWSSFIKKYNRYAFKYSSYTNDRRNFISNAIYNWIFVSSVATLGDQSLFRLFAVLYGTRLNCLYRPQSRNSKMQHSTNPIKLHTAEAIKMCLNVPITSEQLKSLKKVERKLVDILYVITSNPPIVCSVQIETVSGNGYVARWLAEATSALWAGH